jgi:hypothetical protein
MEFHQKKNKGNHCKAPRGNIAVDIAWRLKEDNKKPASKLRGIPGACGEQFDPGPKKD